MRQLAEGGSGGSRSEFLGADNGHDEIHDESEGDEADDEVFHGSQEVATSERTGAMADGRSAQFGASAGVNGAQREKPHGERKEDEIGDLHGHSLRLLAPPA